MSNFTDEGPARSRTRPGQGGTEGASRRRAYALAVAVACAAATLKLALGEYLAAPYLLALAAVALSSSFGGLGPGLVAALLSAVFVYVTQIAPVFTVYVDDPRDLNGIAVFLAVSGAISLIAEQRRQAGNARAASEARYRDLHDNLPDGWVHGDVEGNILESNETFRRMVGYTGAELRALSFPRITPERWHEQERSSVMEAFAQQARTWTYEKEYRRKDGSVFPVEIRSFVEYRDGRPVHISAIVRDVTVRKRVEEAVRSSEALLRAITNSSPDVIFAKDREGRWTFANQAALRILGKPGEEVVGRTDAELLGDPGMASALGEHDRSVLESGVVRSFEEEVPSPSGKRMFITTKAPLRDSGGAIVGTAGVAKDVTDLRRLQEQLQVSSRLAAMGTLVAGVAHEINNPMTGVMAGLGTAMGDVRQALGRMEQGERPTPEALIEHEKEVLAVLGDASEAATRVARIVKDLAIFGAVRQERTRLRPADVVAGAIRWLPSHVHGAASVTVEDLGAPAVTASRGQLEQVLVNLLTNAARATLPGATGTIRVRIGTCPSGAARLEVIDRGTGVDPAILGRIFDPFFTTRPSGEGRGSGLGLAICHAIVTDHGGTITVESEAGKGSTFRVELPAAPAEG